MPRYNFRVDYTETAYGIEYLEVDAVTEEEARRMIAENGMGEYCVHNETVDYDNFEYTEDTLECDNPDPKPTITLSAIYNNIEFDP